MMGYKLQVHKSCWGEAIFPLRVTKNFADFGNGKTTQVAINNFWCFYLQEIRKNTQAKPPQGLRFVHIGHFVNWIIMPTPLRTM